MCLGIAGQVVEILPGSDLARVNVFGVERMVNVGLVEKDELLPGGWVLIHVGFAIAKMAEAEARASMEFLEGMGEAFTAQITSAPEGATNGEIDLAAGAQATVKRSS